MGSSVIAVRTTVGTIFSAKSGTAPSGEVTIPENGCFLINAREWLMRNWHDMDRAEVEAIARGRTTSGPIAV